MTDYSRGAEHIEKRGLKSQARLNKLTITLLIVLCIITTSGTIFSAVSANQAAETSKATQGIVIQGEDNRDRLEALLERIERLQELDAAASKDRAADSVQRAKELKAEINALRRELGLPPSAVAPSQEAAGASGESRATNSPRKPSSSGSVAPRSTPTPSKPTPQPAKPVQPAQPEKGLIDGLLDGIGNIL